MGVRAAVATAMVALALAACSGGDSATPAAGNGSFTLTNTGGTSTWTDVLANLTPTRVPHSTSLSGSSTSLGSISLTLYNTPSTATSATSYTLGLSLGAGTAAFELIADSSNRCTADGGSADVTSYGAVGSTITGTVNVTSWDPSSAGFCSILVLPPQSGTFSIVRSADDVTGVHDGVDTLTVNRTNPQTNFAATDTYTDSAAKPYDPSVQFAYDANYSHVTVDADTNPLGTVLRRQIDLRIYQIAVTTFNLSDVNNYLKETFDATICTANAGTITVTNLGTNGTVVDGTFDVSNAAPGPGCPSAWSGSFHVTND